VRTTRRRRLAPHATRPSKRRRQGPGPGSRRASCSSAASMTRCSPTGTRGTSTSASCGLAVATRGGCPAPRRLGVQRGPGKCALDGAFEAQRWAELDGHLDRVFTGRSDPMRLAWRSADHVPGSENTLDPAADRADRAIDDLDALILSRVDVERRRRCTASHPEVEAQQFAARTRRVGQARDPCPIVEASIVSSGRIGDEPSPLRRSASRRTGQAGTRSPGPTAIPGCRRLGRRARDARKGRSPRALPHPVAATATLSKAGVGRARGAPSALQRGSWGRGRRRARKGWCCQP